MVRFDNDKKENVITITFEKNDNPKLKQEIIRAIDGLYYALKRKGWTK